MTEQLRQKHLEIERRAIEKRELLFEIDCNRAEITERALPNVAAVYRALTEKLGIS